MSEPQREPTASDRDAKTGRVTLSPSALGEVEAHAAARTIDVLRITLEPVEGDPIMLESAGVAADGASIYRVASGLPEVEAHGVSYYRVVSGLPEAEVEGHGHRVW